MANGRLQLDKYLEHQVRKLKETTEWVEELTCRNHELEWTTMSLCRRTHSLADRIGDQEDRRHMPYLRARGYGGVFRKQMGIW